MQGFLLAAGFGTRLWPLSELRAKPAFPYRGVPLVVHTAELMMHHGVREVWINTHHLPESIHAAIAPLRDRLPVHVVHEAEILGTGGALVNLQDQLRRETLVVMNAKVVTDIDLARVVAHARGPLTMVCVENAKREKFTHVQFSADGELQGFVSDLAGVAQPYVFTGIQVLQPSFFGYLPGPGFSDTIKDIYPRLLAASERIHVEVAGERWAEFSTLARYRDLHGEGFVDARAEVEPGADVTRAVVWEHARIGEGASIRGCVVADRVQIPPGFVAENCAIVQAERIRDRRDARVENGLLLAAI